MKKERRKKGLSEVGGLLKQAKGLKDIREGEGALYAKGERYLCRSSVADERKNAQRNQRDLSSWDMGVNTGER